jgi:hypothetical protein
MLYSIDLNEKTARSFVIPSGGQIGAKTIAPQKAPVSGNIRIEQHTIMAGPGVAIAGGIVGGVAGGPPPPFPPGDVLYRTNAEAPKTESLGSQTMEGLRVEGTRTSTIVPAGMIGNDRELVTTFERWVSPDLQTVVMSIVKDPQSGETLYRLNGINRSEPDKSLFQVPSDIKIEKGPEPMMIKRKLDAEQNRNSQPVR